MKKLVLLFILIFILSFNIVLAEETVCAYFFYGNGCPACDVVEPLIDGLEQKYPNFEVHRFEIYDNRSNLLILNEYYDALNIPVDQRYIPVVFISDTYYMGVQPTQNNLELKINELPYAECPTLESLGTGIGDTGSSLKIIGPEFYITIIGAAFVDSINPCAIAVLLILMSALLVAAERKRAFKAGIAFSISIYIVYFLFGLGLFSVIQISGISYLFYQIVGLLAIVIGAFNIKDYFWYGAGGFAMEIPRSWRPTLQKMLKKITSPLGAFLMGFLVCLFELPCTGGPYLFVLGLLAEKTTQMLAIPILLLYNLVFILPLLIITTILYFGYFSVEKAKEWKEKNIRLLHLIAGIIMVILGVVVLLGLV